MFITTAFMYVAPYAGDIKLNEVLEKSEAVRLMLGRSLTEWRPALIEIKFVVVNQMGFK